MVRSLWRLLVRLIQRPFEEGLVPEEVVWATMVFILKGRGGYWGIEGMRNGGEFLTKVERDPT